MLVPALLRRWKASATVVVGTDMEQFTEPTIFTRLD
jgi:hypothetical protein